MHSHEPFRTTPNLVTIEISDEASLLKACDILHDTRFELAKAHFDNQTRKWTAVFIREFFEDPDLLVKRPGFLFTRFTFPMAETVLELDAISEYGIIYSSSIGTYTFNECRPYHGGYRFLFCEGMEIKATFQGNPRGWLRDIRLLDEHGKHFSLRNPFRRR